jgi:peptidoglycan/LPS O-acetylase OafA/YrhL
MNGTNTNGVQGRIQSLDIIRGLAAVSVLFTHLGIPSMENYQSFPLIDVLWQLQERLLWCNGGLHWGVVVFIVLSGYCIHMTAAKKGTKNIVVPHYLRRRFFRIYPVLAISAFVGLIVYSMQYGFEMTHLANLISNLCLIPSIVELPAPLGNNILITVIVECVLYVLYPILLPRTKIQWRVLLAGAVGVYFLNFGALQLFPIDPTWAGTNLFAFFLYWWIGAYFAELSHREETDGISKAPAVLILAIYIGYVLFCNGIHFKGAYVFKSLYLAVMAGYLIWRTTNYEKKGRIDIQSSRVLMFAVALGTYSYSLYVLHLPVVHGVFHWLKDSGYAGTAAQYIITLLIVGAGTWIFYNTIEKRFHRYAIKMSDKWLSKANSITP